MSVPIVKLSNVLKLEYGKALSDSDRDIYGLYAAYGANGEKTRTNKFLYNEPSIIVGRKGSAGELTLVKDKFWALDVTYYVTHDKSKTDLHYLYYALQTKNLTSFARGVKPGINRNDVYELEIPLPSLATQRKIVAKLDAIFAEIDRATAAAEANAKHAESLFQSYLSQVFDSSGDGWEILSIGDICEELFAGGDVPKDRMSKEFGNGFTIPIFTNGEKDKGLYGYTDKARVNKPSITVSARGTIGYSQVRVDPFFPAIRLIVATPKDEIVELGFLKYAIKSLNFIHSGASIPQLTVPMIKDYRVTIPKLKNEQLKIVEKIDGLSLYIDKLKNSETNKVIEFTSLKKVILKQAFNGELVKE